MHVKVTFIRIVAKLFLTDDKDEAQPMIRMKHKNMKQMEYEIWRIKNN